MGARSRSLSARTRTAHHTRLRVRLEGTRAARDAAREATAAARAESLALSQRLSQGEALREAILDDLDLGIVGADSLGALRFANRAARQLLELPATGGGLAIHWLQLESSPDALLGDRSNVVMPHRISNAAGETIELEMSVSRPSSASHPSLGFFFIFRDTREEKARSLERERLERLAAIGTMVAGFAHEVRNPVAALRSLAESLTEELSDAKITVPHVSRMLQVLERLERLVRTSLQFGRPAAPRRESNRTVSIINAAFTELGPRTAGYDEKLRVEVEPDLPDVFVDHAQLVQVLIILLNNALDSVTTPSRVTVRARSDQSVPLAPRERARDSQPPASGRAVRLEVHDDGPGIAPENRGHIFDPFFTTKASGTGLGLSIAQQIVSENGGRLEVASQRGSTTFAVVIPVTER